eukprot:TRINITY_DN38208_c0_g1_i2.p1 TRINITY_DN38208_c0_g1~~TRINITY_DN38208_c0_g1_i2.p1  ORF type:complete len:435 (-),score=58.26 TRINITY_DN38208_c0_g1_i2:59-1258(-)
MSAAAGVPLATIQLVNKFAVQKIRRIRLNDLVIHMHRVYKAGEPEAFVKMGFWLHEELRVRFAHQLLDYYRLPYMVLMCKPFAEVHDMHLRTFDVLSELPEMKTGRDVVMFARTLRREFQSHGETVNLLRQGLSEMRHNVDVGDLKPLHGFMDKFLTTKIGNRVLAENFVNWLDRVKMGNVHITAPGVVNECTLAPLLANMSSSIGGLCRDIYGQSPDVIIDDSLDTTVPIIPAHLNFIFQEVLKNSVHATMEYHLSSGSACDAPPPIHVSIRPGTFDVDVKVSDRGGGIKRRVQRKIWNYNFSAPPASADGAPPSTTSLLQTVHEDRKLKRQLSGYGVGMPISRLFARYFGGDLMLSSVYGYGTDVSIRLNRLGDHVELGCSTEDDVDGDYTRPAWAE